MKFLKLFSILLLIPVTFLFAQDEPDSEVEEVVVVGSQIVMYIQENIDENDSKITAETIRAIVVLSQMNLHIWHNESNYRNGIKDGNNLELTHGLNGIRNTAKNKIQEIMGGRKDYKIDCLAADFKDWEISW